MPKTLSFRELVQLILNFLLIILFSQPSLSKAQGSWSPNAFTGDYPHKRHESAFVQVGDKFYLLGGRKSHLPARSVKEYDFGTSTWSNKATPPVEMHHFQAVTLDGMIYVVCGMRGNYPNETPLTNIYIYDPINDTWTTGPEIPVSRRRGSSGIVVYDGKIYVLSGIQNGHTSGWVTWADVFDPSTNSWSQLADAPRARDHFSAVLVNDKIYLAGGRRSGSGANVFSGTVAEVDVYDIPNNTWTTLAASANIPTERAGCMSVLMNNELLIIGGENGTSTQANNEVEALDLNTFSWSTWTAMPQRRHGTQAILNNGKIYLAAGAGPNRGGNEIDTNNVNFMVVGDYPGSASPSGVPITKGDFNPNPGSLDFGTVSVGNSYSLNAKLKNNSGNQGLIIDNLSLSGTDNTEFSLTPTQSLPIIIPPGDSAIIAISFEPASNGSKSATLEANTSGNTNLVSVSLSGIGNNGGLPVEWLDFQAQYQAPHVVLTWITANESNHDYYSVESSIEGADFEEIVQVNTKSSQSISTFTAVDHYPELGQRLIYRIREVDLDGKSSFSPSVELKIPPQKVHFSPNPLSHPFYLTIAKPDPALSFDLKLYTLTGQEVKRFEFTADQSQATLLVNLSELASGSYFVSLSNSSGLTQRSILIIQ